MDVLPWACRAASASFLHRDGARVVYATPQSAPFPRLSLQGRAGWAVLGCHAELAHLGYKDCLAQHVASAALRPRTVVGPARFTPSGTGASTLRAVIKPVDGSCGRGVCLVELVPESTCVLVPEGFVAQDVVDCATVGGLKADVRLWMCIHGRGAPPWIAPSCLVRVARHAGLFCTNTAAAPPGFPTRDFEDASAAWYAPAAAMAAAFEKSVRLALAVASADVWTLVGLDVAVDRQGRPWLLELNTCPFHDTRDARWGRMFERWLGGELAQKTRGNKGQ